MSYLEYCMRSIKESFIPWLKKFKLSFLINFLLVVIFIFLFKVVDMLWAIDVFIWVLAFIIWVCSFIMSIVAFNISYNDYLYKKERGYLK